MRRQYEVKSLAALERFLTVLHVNDEIVYHLRIVGRRMVLANHAEEELFRKVRNLAGTDLYMLFTRKTKIGDESVLQWVLRRVEPSAKRSVELWAKLQ